MNEAITPQLLEPVKADLKERFGSKEQQVSRNFDDMIDRIVQTPGVEPERLADLATSGARDYIANLGISQTDWETRIAAVREQLEVEKDKEGLDELYVLERRVREVHKQTFREKVDAAGETEINEFVAGAVDVIDMQVMADLTDPEYPIEQYYLPQHMQDPYNKALIGLLVHFGLSGPLEGQMALLKGRIEEQCYQKWLPAGQKTAEHVAIYKRMYKRVVDSLLTRWIQGAPIGDCAEIKSNPRSIRFQRNSEMSEDVLNRYAIGFGRLTDYLDSTLDAEALAGTNFIDRISGQHDRGGYVGFVSRIFDGLSHSENLAEGADLQAILRRPDRGSPNEFEFNRNIDSAVQSFALGRGLRVLVEGGDKTTYEQCLNNITDEGWRDTLGQIAMELWPSLEQGEQRRKVAEILQHSHLNILVANPLLHRRVIEALGLEEDVKGAPGSTIELPTVQAEVATEPPRSEDKAEFINAETTMRKLVTEFQELEAAVKELNEQLRGVNAIEDNDFRYDLHSNFFIQSHTHPLKYALHLRGLGGGAQSAYQRGEHLLEQNQVDVDILREYVHGRFENFDYFLHKTLIAEHLISTYFENNKYYGQDSPLQRIGLISHRLRAQIAAIPGVTLHPIPELMTPYQKGKYGQTGSGKPLFNDTGLRASLLADYEYSRNAVQRRIETLPGEPTDYIVDIAFVPYSIERFVNNPGQVTLYGHDFPSGHSLLTTDFENEEDLRRTIRALPDWYRGRLTESDLVELYNRAHSSSNL